MQTRLCPTRLIVTFGAVCLTLGLWSDAVLTQRPRFYPDDPIAREPESQDASPAQPYQQPDVYEQIRNLFVTPHYKPSGLRAQNINTIEELPDSSWFTNRIGARTVTAEELAVGAIVGPPPDPSHWVLTREKSSGAHPGFTARDARGDTFFVEFDSKPFPGGPTAAVIIASKIFWALGYNQVETYLTTFDPKRVTIDPAATALRPSGARTRFTRDDMNAILENVAKNADGTYRVVAGRLLPGKILGEFRYSGTRPDDPNDVVPHEYHRELRALRVFGAWANLTDLKEANTLDTLVSDKTRSLIRHYLQDVGSTFGMPNDVHEWDLSWEHFYQTDTTLRRLWSFGFSLSPWQTVHYDEYPSAGKFEGDVFDPRTWRPQMPTVTYLEMRPDDAFWAALRIAAFSDDLIRAAVHTGEFTDPEAERHIADVLIKRRDKIKQVYLPAVNPIVNPQLETDGRLTFENAAVTAGVARAAAKYRTAWARFDNTIGDRGPLTEATGTTTTIDAPYQLPNTIGSFITVEISAESTEHPAWSRPVRTYFRRERNGWKLVGLERLPEKIEMATSVAQCLVPVARPSRGSHLPTAAAAVPVPCAW